jgi:sulfur carrier protein ThiS
LKIRVRLIGHFVTKCGFSEKELEVPDASVVVDVLERLELKDVPHVVARNGQGLRDCDRLEEGDRVVVSPVFSGG